jgi:hypothetical protein
MSQATILGTGIRPFFVSRVIAGLRNFVDVSFPERALLKR